MIKMLFPLLFASLLALAVAADKATEKAEAPSTQPKEAALECKCGCRNCPPSATLSKNKADLYRYRRCFRDANKDGTCDNSVAAGQKCQNDCIAVTLADAKKQNKQVPLPCANCPCAANCAKCVTQGK